MNELDEIFIQLIKLNIRKNFYYFQNNLKFSSWKNNLGINDIIAILIYVIIKAKSKNLFKQKRSFEE